MDFKDKKGRSIQCKMSCIPVRLCEFPSKDLVLTVVYGFGEEPMLLLSNLKMMGDDESNNAWNCFPNYIVFCSREFRYVNEGILVQMLNLLARVRNVCAHNERLYDYKYRKGTISNTEIHAKLCMKKEEGQYIKGKNDLFAVVIVFWYLLEKCDFIGFLNEFDKIFSEL